MLRNYLYLSVIFMSFPALIAMESSAPSSGEGKSNAGVGLTVFLMAKALTKYTADGNLDMALSKARDLPKFLLNYKDARGRTALHYAAERGYVDLARTLITRGAKYDIPDNEGNTPLMLAEREKHQEIVNLISQ